MPDIGFKHNDQTYGTSDELGLVEHIPEAKLDLTREDRRLSLVGMDMRRDLQIL